MRVAVRANDELKDELLFGGINEACKIEWIQSADELSRTAADAVFDLLFEINNYDIAHLKKITGRPVFVNSVSKTIAEIGMPFIRINGWPGFLKRNIAEVACIETQKKEAEYILSLLNRKTEFVPDSKGFVSARVVTMIINEAYLALQENVSTKDEIDIAMKLGTNYPYGPFEWAKKIGLKKIAALLAGLSKTGPGYEPAELLLKASKE